MALWATAGPENPGNVEMSNLKPILYKLLFHLTPKGRLNWDPTGTVESSPPTPSDCQQSL